MPSVLIVEDERLIRRYAAAALQLAGVQVEAVEDGCLGIEFLRSAAQNGELPRVVVLDVVMPCMNGEQVFAAIAEEAWANTITVIFTSAGGSQFGSQIAANAPFPKSHFLTKPYDVKALVELIRTIAPDIFST
jgi:CheY-like chemotaxis protein